VTSPGFHSLDCSESEPLDQIFHWKDRVPPQSCLIFLFSPAPVKFVDSFWTIFVGIHRLPTCFSQLFFFFEGNLVPFFTPPSATLQWTYDKIVFSLCLRPVDSLTFRSANRPPFRLFFTFPRTFFMTLIFVFWTPLILPSALSPVPPSPRSRKQFGSTWGLSQSAVGVSEALVCILFVFSISFPPGVIDLASSLFLLWGCFFG